MNKKIMLFIAFNLQTGILRIVYQNNKNLEIKEFKKLLEINV